MKKELGCIYKIVCVENQKFYYGRAKNFDSRKSSHLSYLRNNKHVNKHLQRVFNKYGENSLEFSIQCTVPLEELEELEQLVIDEVFDDPLCMNLSRYSTTPVTYGDKFSEERCRNISNSLKGKKRSVESCAKQSKTRMGCTHSKEHCLNISKALRIAKSKSVPDILAQHPELGTTIFPSQRQAARVLGVQLGSINYRVTKKPSLPLLNGWCVSYVTAS